MHLTPTAANQIFQDAIGAGFLAAVVGALSYWQDCPIAVTAGIALAIGSLAFTLVHLRFRLHAPRQITLDAEGIRIISRSGQTQFLRWSQVTSANHSTELGMKWVLKSSIGAVVVRDDGISSKDWSVLSALLCQELGNRNVPIRVDLIYLATIEER